jgi:hypothetical protein
MASNGGIIAAFVGAILVSFALGYFVLPLLVSTPTPSGVIRQVQSVQSNTQAYIYSSDSSWRNIPNMSLIIKTTHSSRLHATFSSPVDITLPPSASGRAMWNFSLVIAGIGSRNGTVGYMSQAAVADYVQLYETFSLEFITTTIPAGSYNVTAYWAADSVVTQVCSIQLSTVTFNYTRSLTVEELNI